MSTEGEGPLHGVRVVDLGHLWAAPMASMLLADQGASVVRIVRPGAPERHRRSFTALQRNKTVVEADLRTDEGRAAVDDLIARADVVVESFRPGVMARHGLDAATLTGAKPSLVHLALPGFSTVDEERRDLPGWEGVIGAATGLFTTGLRQGLGAPPVFHAVPIASAFAAAHGAIAVIAALHRRRVGDGGGATIEVPLAHAAFAACSRSFCFAGNGVRSADTEPRAVPRGLGSLVIADEDDEATREAKLERLGALAPPNYSTHHYRSSDDRRLLVMPIKPDMVRRHLRVLGLEDEVLAHGFEIGDPWARVAPAGDADLAGSWTMSPDRNRWMIDRIQQVIGTRTADEWLERFTAAGIPCAAMHTRAEWMARPEVRAAGLVVPLADGDGTTSVVGRLADVDLGSVRVPRFTMPRTVDDGSMPTGWEETPSSGEPTPSTPVTTKADLLTGVRVLDLCNVVAGPNAGYVFAQMGADVIRVEPPTSFNLPMHHAWTLEVNQGKRSVVLDTRSIPGRRAFERLVRSVDVVIHNRLSDVAERLGLDPATLAETNPDVVVCQISAFGGTVESEDPTRPGIEAQPGYDPMPNLSTGLDALLGSPDAPRQAEEILSDLLGGLSGALGAMAALHHRAVTGVAAPARGSLARGTSFLQAPWMVGDEPAEGWPDATGPASLGFSSVYGAHRTADGWVFVAAPERSPEDLAALLDTTTGSLEDRFATASTAHWCAVLADAGVAAHEIVSIDDLCAAATPVDNTTVDLQADGPLRIRTWPDHPSGVPVVLPEPAWVLVGPDRSYRRLAPTPVVGAHTREVLAEAGLTVAAIDHLYEARIAHDHLPAVAPGHYFHQPRVVSTAETAEASPEAAPGVLAELDDRAAAIDLLHRYCYAVADGDLDAIVGCFTPDAEMDVLGDVHRGHDGLRAMYVGALRTGPKPFLHNVIVEAADADRLRTRCVARIEREADGTSGYGRYDDELVRTADGWRFRRRTYRRY